MANSKIQNAAVHHIALSVSDFDKSVKFYTSGLGFVQTAQWGEGDSRAVMLDIGNGSHFELFAGGTAQQAQNERFIHLAFATTDPDTAYRNALAAGATPHKEPTDVSIPSQPPMQVRLAFVKGPDGELLEFFHNKG